MPHSLTERQKEVLDFIRGYVRENECSPRLDEIATSFNVKPPTAHKLLEALQRKGYLYFGRDDTSGFFIRLIERAGSPERVIEVPIAGKITRFGEVIDFPIELGHFASVVIGSDPTDVFALFTTEDIPEVSACSQDLILFDLKKKPQPGDICLTYIGEKLFLIKIMSETYDERLHSLVIAQQYPIPEKIKNQNVKHKLNWIPLAYSEKNNGYYQKIIEEQGWRIGPMSPDLIAATAIRLVRQMAF